MGDLEKISIELTSFCNFKCVGCPTLNLPRGKGHMKMELFEKIIGESKLKIEKIFLWNYGEPLMNPNIEKMMDVLSEFPGETVMSTNCSLLGGFEDLSFLGVLSEIILSINGLDQESYEFHQKGGSLKEAISGVKKLSKTLKTNSFKTKLILQIVANKKNMQSLSSKKLKKFGGELGVDIVVVKSFNVMDKNKETFNKFVPKNTKYSRYKKNTKSDKYPCRNTIVINWDGSVNPCCFDYKGEYILGNVKDDTIFQIWNSEKSKKLREGISRSEFPSFCVDCAGSKVIDQIDISNKKQDTRSI